MNSAVVSSSELQPFETPRPLNSLPSPSPRLMSVDALRGFDMFWILGAGSVMDGLSKTSVSGFAHVMAEQLDHADWEGFRLFDLIFPLFIFIVGISLVF